MNHCESCNQVFDILDGKQCAKCRYDSEWFFKRKLKIVHFSTSFKRKNESEEIKECKKIKLENNQGPCARGWISNDDSFTY